MTTPTRPGAHARPPRVAPVPMGAVVLVVAAVAAAGAAALSLATGSARPATVLPVVAVALGGLRTNARVTAAAAVLIVAGAVAGLLAVGPPAASEVTELGAVLGFSALGALAWRLQRGRADRALLAESERADSASVVDALTGRLNTSGLELLGQHMLAAVRRQSGAVHCAIIEVEGVAQVLDGMGPSAVEEVLVSVADCLRGATRGSDVVARYTEVSFVVIGPGTGMTALDLERRVRGALLQSPPLSLREWPCTVLVGIGQLQPWDSGGIAEIIARADEDLNLRRALRSPALDPQASPLAVDPGA